jgi:two-component system sensor histidine kinase CpxA
MWMPFVRGITGFIRTLNTAAGRIAHGNFDERIEKQRNDELGELSTSVNAMAAQLGGYMTQQRRITADVAHELCSPIARMQMALGVVEQRSTPEQATYLQKLDRELQHMAKLVEEVLAFTKAETLPERESPKDIDLRELLQNILAREAPENGIQLDIGDIKLHSLRNALDRAIGNVVRNAVRYAKDIEITAKAENGRVGIQIADRGPGVSEEAVSRLFEPFYRPEAARGRNTGGSGLGLAITKRCIEACGGTVTARNREGGGLVVDFSLPSLDTIEIKPK